MAETSAKLGDQCSVLRAGHDRDEGHVDAHRRRRSEAGFGTLDVVCTFPRAHWLQIHSTNPLERLNAEIKRSTNVVGIFPNVAAITRLVGAMMLEQNDEWSLNRR